MPRTGSRLTGACLLMLVAACGESGSRTTSPTFPKSVTFDVIAGGGQTAQAGQPLPLPIQVKVVDPTHGGPIPGYLVNWVVTSGGGSIFVGATQTGVQGITQNYWTLGPSTGPQTLEVRAISPVTGQKLTFATVTATATPIIEGILPGHTYHFSQSYDGTAASVNTAWNFKNHLLVMLIDDQTGQIGEYVNYWVTDNAGGCSWTTSTLTCPTAGTFTVNFQQDGFNGVDNPAFRPAISLLVQ